MKNNVMYSIILILSLSILAFHEENSDFRLEKLDFSFTRRELVVLVILDGFGEGENNLSTNPIVAANPIYYKKILEKSKKQNLYLSLRAHGTAVGLASKTENGNSEVGHNSIGSGGIHIQGSQLIDIALNSSSLVESEEWKRIVQTKGTLHFFGLLSDAGSHSHINQLLALIDKAVQFEIRTIRVHIILDGVDAKQGTAEGYIDTLERKLSEVRNKGVDARVASGGGRRRTTMAKVGQEWSIVEAGYKHMVYGEVSEKDKNSSYSGNFPSAGEAFKAFLTTFPNQNEKEMPPFVIVDNAGKPIGPIRTGDSVVNFNFRADRMISISRAFDEDDAHFGEFARPNRPKNVSYASLVVYDENETSSVPQHFLGRPPSITHTLSKYLLAQGLNLYAVAESLKFWHVTKYFNGNHAGEVGPTIRNNFEQLGKEKYEKVLSLPETQTETSPEMMARNVTDKLVEAINSKEYQLLWVNLANPDMVGHTGNFTACVEAVRVIDKSLKLISKAVEEKHGVLIVTADHGNVEDKVRELKTKTTHTNNTVPFLIVDFFSEGDYQLVAQGEKPDAKEGEDFEAVEGPGLSNIAATILNLFGYEAPEHYRKSLLVFPKKAKKQVKAKAETVKVEAKKEL